MKKIILSTLGLMATLGLTSCASVSTTSEASQENGSISPIVMIIVYAVIIGAMYLYFMRTNAKKKKQEEQMRDSLEIGDELITIGGITGRVVSIKEDGSFILETGPDRTKMHFQKWALSTITTEKNLTDHKAEKKAEKEKKKKEKAEEK